jgi:hypothetical protein
LCEVFHPESSDNSVIVIQNFVHHSICAAYADQDNNVLPCPTTFTVWLIARWAHGVSPGGTPLLDATIRLTEDGSLYNMLPIGPTSVAKLDLRSGFLAVIVNLELLHIFAGIFRSPWPKP